MNNPLVRHHRDVSSSARAMLGRLLSCLIAVLSMAGAALAEPVRIGGTGVGSALFERLAQEYRKSTPGAEINVLMPPLGSNGGVRALRAGGLEIALLGRAPTADESTQLQAETYARTPFVIVVNGPHAPRLSFRELADIYAGRRTQWEDGTPIRLVMRSKNESDMLILRGMAPELNEAVDAAYLRKGLLYADNDLDAIDLVARLPGAIGPTTLGLARLDGRRVNPVVVNGVEASDKLIASGGYPWMKPIVVATSTAPNAAVKGFLGFARSDRGRRLAAGWGFFPIAP